MTLSIKKTVMAFALTSIVFSSLKVQGSETDIKEVRNEAGIMLNILQASLKQRISNKNIRFRAESVFYLANQGLVFEIESGRRGGNFFGFDLAGLINNIPVAPTAPIAIHSSQSTDGNRFEMSIGEREMEVVNFIDEGEVEALVKSIMRHGGHYDDDLNDKIRELSEEQRELGWEIREHDRANRDLEFEKRNADSSRRKEIEKRLKELNKKVLKLKIKSKELKKYRSDLQTERNQKVAKIQVAKQQLYKKSLALFEDTIGDMLCRYGAGLRSLSDEENLTFLLPDFVEADHDSVKGSYDKVYVFNHKDIQACVTGKSSKDILLTAAKTYLL
ncbi:MAG: hypothetical protein JKY14_07880 [Paraglaciecola sp.]|nr:hypothetical protein [Paraglaciecola sp.]